MRSTFNAFLESKLFEDLIQEINEETLLDILALLKKKISVLLKESTLTDVNTDVLKYLKIVAIFEQLFRYVTAKKINLLDVPGFKRIIDNKDLEHVDETRVEAEINQLINKYFDNRLSGFKNVVQKRFNDFKDWFFSDNKDDLKIVNDAVDFTIAAIEKFNYEARRR